MELVFRPAIADDIEFLIDAEGAPENRDFIAQWSREQHAASLADLDYRYSIIEEDGARIGFMIFQELASPHASVNLRRLVVTSKGRGIGRAAVCEAKRLAFEEWNAHRFWLDVKAHNLRARYLYESEGFVVEGVLRECLRTDSGFDSLVVLSILRQEYASPGNLA